MKYSYQSKNFGYIGQPDVKTFREVLESFGMTEKEIGEIIMECERYSLPRNYMYVEGYPFSNVGLGSLYNKNRRRKR